MCSLSAAALVEMISQGASRVNLSFVVAEAHPARVVRLLHRGLGWTSSPGRRSRRRRGEVRDRIWRSRKLFVAKEDRGRCGSPKALRGNEMTRAP